MTDKLLRSKYNFTNRLCMSWGKRTRPLGTELCRAKGPGLVSRSAQQCLRSKHLKESQALILQSNRSQNQRSLSENYGWALETQKSVSGEWQTRDNRKCSDLAGALICHHWHELRGPPPAATFPGVLHCSPAQVQKIKEREEVISSWSVLLLINKSRT